MALQDNPIITSKDLMILIIACAAVLLILLITVIVLYTVFQRRKIRFINERNEAEKKYLEEVSKTTVEVQENTLKNVSWELHDNIGQLLSVAVMQLNMLTPEECESESIKDTKALLSKSLQEVRSLSKSLNQEVVTSVGLVESIENELSRFDRLNFLKPRLKIHGIPWSFDKNTEILVFRIIQEFFTNVIKHAKAGNLKVKIWYEPDLFKIKIEDDGIGFDPRAVALSSGMVNMQARAKLLSGELSVDSIIGQGTTLDLSLPRPHKKEKS